jgi:hypothetical protein
MIGGRTLETCWAVNKRQDNKLEHCCIWLVIYLNCTMMDGLTNLELKKVFVFPFSKTSRYVLFYSTAAEIWKHANAGSVTHLLTLVTNVCIYFSRSSWSIYATGDGYSPNLTKARKTIFSVCSAYKYWEIFYALNYWPKFKGAFYRSRGGAVGSDTALKPERSRIIGIFHWQNTSGLTTVLWSTQNWVKQI